MTQSLKFVLAATAAFCLSFTAELSAQSGSRTPLEAGSATSNVPIESQSAPGLGSGTRNVPMADSGSVVSDAVPAAQPVPMTAQDATLSTPMAGCGCTGNSTSLDYTYGQPTMVSPTMGTTYSGGTYYGSYNSGCCAPTYSTRSYFAPSWRYRWSYFGGFRSSNCCGW